MGVSSQTICSMSSMSDGFQYIYIEIISIKNVENCYFVLWKVTLMVSTVSTYLPFSVIFI